MYFPPWLLGALIIGLIVTLGQGFFRIWLFLSAIWIGLSIFGHAPKTYSWLWHAPQYEIKVGRWMREYNVSADTLRTFVLWQKRIRGAQLLAGHVRAKHRPLTWIKFNFANCAID
jgi:hypothetical protein